MKREFFLVWLELKYKRILIFFIIINMLFIQNKWKIHKNVKILIYWNSIGFN